MVLSAISYTYAQTYSLKFGIVEVLWYVIAHNDDRYLVGLRGKTRNSNTNSSTHSCARSAIVRFYYVYHRIHCMELKWESERDQSTANDASKSILLRIIEQQLFSVGKQEWQGMTTIWLKTYYTLPKRRNSRRTTGELSYPCIKWLKISYTIQYTHKRTHIHCYITRNTVYVIW